MSENTTNPPHNSLKILFFILLLPITIITLSGCASCFPDLRIQKAEDNGFIYINMTLNELKKVVGREPECTLTDYCRTEHSAGGDYFIWTVGGNNRSHNLLKTYSFRFKDNHLVSWGNN